MRWRSLLATAFAAAFAVAPLAPGSAMADDDTSTVSWSVRPSSADGPDGRAWIELDVDPGEEVAEHLSVFNYGDRDVDFRLSAADGYFTETGRFNMLPADHESVDAGTWISLQTSVSVPAKSGVTVPFTISVPENATPGDHLAGVAASISSAGSGNVAVESRVGFRVLSRVSGELQPALTAYVLATYEGSVNPFEPGTAVVDYAISNTGNTRLAATPVIAVSGPFGAFAQSIPGDAIDEMGPGETRTFRVEVPDVWPLGLLSVDVSADPHVVPAESDTTPLPAAQSTALTAAIPWSQLVVVLVVVLLVWWWRRDRRRLRRDLQRQVAEAREQVRTEGEGRASVGVGIAAVIVAVGLILAVPVSATADTGADGIVIDIEIQPVEPPERASTVPRLPATGAEIDAWTIAAGGTLSALGVLLVASRRRRTAAPDR